MLCGPAEIIFSLIERLLANCFFPPLNRIMHISMSAMHPSEELLRVPTGKYITDPTMRRRLFASFGKPRVKVGQLLSSVDKGWKDPGTHRTACCRSKALPMILPKSIMLPMLREYREVLYQASSSERFTTFLLITCKYLKL